MFESIREVLLVVAACALLVGGAIIFSFMGFELILWYVRWRGWWS